jgi:hypothetical protein
MCRAGYRTGNVRLPSHRGRHDSVRPRQLCSTEPVITVYGVVALTFMMAMNTLEGRGRRFVLAFAGGCFLSSAYGFLAGTWPFGVVEGVWGVLALRRFTNLRAA